MKIIRVKSEHTKPKNLHDSVFICLFVRKKRYNPVWKTNACQNHIIVQFHSAETIRRELILMAVNPQGEQQK